MLGEYPKGNQYFRRELSLPRPVKNRSITNYSIDLGIIVTSIILFFTGIIKFLEIWGNFTGLSYLAALLSNLHDWSGLILGILVFIHLVLHWKWMVAMTKNLFKFKRLGKKYVNYFIDLGMLISFLIVFITGILKFPAFLLITGYFYTVSEEIFILHDWFALLIAGLAVTHVTLHWKWIVRMTKKIIRKDRSQIIIEVGAIIALLLILVLPAQSLLASQKHPGNEIVIGGIGIFKFNPDEVQTIRPDLFRSGHYSIFDILVDLDNRGEIDMNYTYDNTMDTYVINSINDISNWWYIAYYDQGWRETNVWRIDHFPYKPKMYIELFTTSSSAIQFRYNTFKEEIIRLTNNNSTIIIPDIYIRSPTNNLHFQNVEVTPYNTRDDFFQDGVITAIDAIMSLGDQGLLTYKLNWYTTIGLAEVKNYYIDGINSDNAYGKCGFVYEVGDTIFSGFTGNHIHIPSDIRILTSPEYEEWFWICL
jgi:hypothetical protein